MKNKTKKMLAGLLTATCLTGLLAGCANTEQNEVSKESGSASTENTSQSQTQEGTTTEEKTEITYPMEGNVTLTLAMVGEQAVTSRYKDLSETPFGKAWQEATGVTLKIDQYNDDAALNLMIAGGDLPDMILLRDSDYSGGLAKAIADGVVEPINDYAEFCPDLMIVLNSKESYMKSATNSKGDIIGFPTIRGDDSLLTSCGMIIRQDYLDALGLELPRTADEFYETLKAIKEKLGVEAPFSPNIGYLYGHGICSGLMTSPFGLVKGDFYVDNDQVHYGVYEKEYKDVLAYLNKLYDEGLMDPNFATQDTNTMRANFMNGVSGACIDTPGGGMGGFLDTMKDDATFDCSGFGPLVAKQGDIPLATHYSNAFTGYYMIITTACENKEAAAQFLNYGYTEEGHVLFNFGIEGESYEMIDGYPTFTEAVMNPGEGLTSTHGKAAYMRSWSSGPFVQDKRSSLQPSMYPQQIDAIELWSISDASKYQYPAANVAEEDSAEYSKIMGDVSTFISEMTIKYINGEADLDNFETEYLAVLKEMGMDRVIEMKQDAYDQYNNK